MAALGFTRQAAHPFRAQVVGCLLAAAGCGYSEKEVAEKVNVKVAEVRFNLEQDIAKLFLTGVVEEDYGGAQILLAKSAPLASRAKDAPGREKALREFVRGWLAEHGQGGARFEGSHIRGAAPSGEKHLDWVLVGYFELAGPGERKVHFRVSTSGHRIWGFELSERELPYG